MKVMADINQENQMVLVEHTRSEIMQKIYQW